MKEFQEKFLQVIIPFFEGSINDRKKYYLDNPKPEKQNIDEIINSISLKNGAISGISGLIPGPAGLIAIIPELKATIGNQITMIYDIGVANGKEEHMSKEMVLSLAMQSGFGSAGINALARQGEKVLIKKASVKAFQQLAKSLGIKVSQSVVKSTVTKFVPVLGGVAIGIWVKYTTAKIGENSAFVLGQNLQIEEIDKVEEIGQDEEEKLEVLENKVIVLMNLMKADGESGDKEKEYISQIIENIDFGFITKAKFKVDLNLSSQTEVDFKILASSTKSDKDSLLIDMISLAKRDGKIHEKEFEYIMEVCEKIDLDTKFAINELGANYLAVKYFLKGSIIETNGVAQISFNNSKNKALFYNNNRVFIQDENNQIIKKGTYQNGGRKIILDGTGATYDSNVVLENLMRAVL